MPKKIRDNLDPTVELLQKLLVLQLHALGAPQHRIAKMVGRQKAWVNELVKGLPRGKREDGGRKSKKPRENDASRFRGSMS